MVVILTPIVLMVVGIPGYVYIYIGFMDPSWDTPNKSQRNFCSVPQPGTEKCPVVLQTHFFLVPFPITRKVMLGRIYTYK